MNEYIEVAADYQTGDSSYEIEEDCGRHDARDCTVEIRQICVTFGTLWA